MPSTAAKLPAPPPTREGAPTPTHNAESHRIVRERVFPPSQLSSLLQVIRDAHLTGTVMLDVSQGTIASVRFREEHPLNFSTDTKNT